MGLPAALRSRIRPNNTTNTTNTNTEKPDPPSPASPSSQEPPSHQSSPEAQHNAAIKRATRLRRIFAWSASASYLLAWICTSTPNHVYSFQLSREAPKNTSALNPPPTHPQLTLPNLIFSFSFLFNFLEFFFY